jgi:hypothetical protein
VKADNFTTIKNLSFSTAYNGPGMRQGIPIKPGLDTIIRLKTAAQIQTIIKWSTYPQSPFGEKRDSLTVARDDSVKYPINL